MSGRGFKIKATGDFDTDMDNILRLTDPNYSRRKTMSNQPRGSHIHLMERQGSAAPGEIVKFVITFPQPMLAADAEAYVARNAAAIGAGTFKSVKPTKSGGPDIICTEKEPTPAVPAVQALAAADGESEEDIFKGDVIVEGDDEDMFGG